MREILFRGKRIDNREWVEGFLSKGRLPGYKGNTLQTCIDFEEKGVMLSSVILPETVCEYTGLTDKNGNRIFEGDIILAGHYKWKCKVVWDEKCARFIGLTNDRDVKIVYVDMVNKNNESAVEVIGNIFDKPELLEVNTNETTL